MIAKQGIQFLVMSGLASIEIWYIITPHIQSKKERPDESQLKGMKRMRIWNPPLNSLYCDKCTYVYTSAIKRLL